MTPQEIQAIRIEAAKEDLDYVVENGGLTICDTHKGNIYIETEGPLYQASNFNNWNEKYTLWISYDEMVEWLKDQYIVEIEA